MDNTGVIISTAQYRARASGLSAAALFDLVEIDGGVRGLVAGLMRDYVELSLLTEKPVEAGQPVRLLGKALVSTDGLDTGRYLAGNDIFADTATPDGAVPLFPVKKQRSLPVTRRREPFYTGLLAYDLMGRLRRGDAILLSGAHSQPSLLPDAAARLLHFQKGAFSFCICLNLRAGSAPLRTVDSMNGIEPLDPTTSWARTIVLDVGENAAPAMTLLLCRAAMALASYLAGTGKQVILLVDDLAALQRLNGAGLPGCNAFVELGLLTSCADLYGSGTITAIVGASHRTPYESRQFFDTELDLGLAEAGSIDHRGSKLCNPPVRVEPMRMLGALVIASAVADAQCGKEVQNTSAVDDLALRGRRVQQALRFATARRLDIVEQTLCVLAVHRLDGLKASDLSLFIEKYLHALRWSQELADLRRNTLIADNPAQPWFRLALEIAAQIRNNH